MATTVRVPPASVLGAVPSPQSTETVKVVVPLAPVSVNVAMTRLFAVAIPSMATTGGTLPEIGAAAMTAVALTLIDAPPPPETRTVALNEPAVE